MKTRHKATLMELLALFGIELFYTDKWGAYSRQLGPRARKPEQTWGCEGAIAWLENRDIRGYGTSNNSVKQPAEDAPQRRLVGIAKRVQLDSWLGLVENYFQLIAHY